MPQKFTQSPKIKLFMNGFASEQVEMVTMILLLPYLWPNDTSWLPTSRLCFFKDHGKHCAPKIYKVALFWFLRYQFIDKLNGCFVIGPFLVKNSINN